MKNLFITFTLLISALFSSAQIGPYKYFIEFTDKTGTPYSVNDPSAFLSDRAILRRVNQGISITEQDLPVNPAYVSQIAGTGAMVLTRSKWFNGVTVYTVDSTILQTIEAFPFVKSIRKSGTPVKQQVPEVDKFALETAVQPVKNFHSFLKSTQNVYDYGPSYRQIQMLNGDILHNNGYNGAGKVIAVIDAGFLMVDQLIAFDSLRQNGQILGVKDFVEPGGNVYTSHIHGMMVLSTIGGNVPGQLVGTAPKANFWLLRSEDAATEYVIEEYNWVSAAEFADSVGADIITSSLGYTTFNDPAMNHTCADMDGHTNPSTRGANIASLKGMVVVCSAGNEGGSMWTCVSSPSDGDNVLSIAAVDSNGVRASFSSVGIDTNGRVKPNIAAMGENVVVEWVDNNTTRSSGTSFSCPITSGMIACLWQAHPEATPAEIYRAVEMVGNQYAHPDSLLGYGIPDYSAAITVLGNHNLKQKNELIIYPNPFRNDITVSFGLNKRQEIRIFLYDLMGHVVYSQIFADCSTGENFLRLSGLTALSQGLYLVKVQGSDFEYSGRVLKQ